MKALLVLLISFSAFAENQCWQISNDWKVCADISQDGRKTIFTNIRIPMNGSPGELRSKRAAKRLCELAGMSFVRFQEAKSNAGCFYDPKHGEQVMCFDYPVSVKMVTEVTCK